MLRASATFSPTLSQTTDLDALARRTNRAAGVSRFNGNRHLEHFNLVQSAPAGENARDHGVLKPHGIAQGDDFSANGEHGAVSQRQRRKIRGGDSKKGDIQVSVERVMGCGMGGCYSCVIPVRERAGGQHYVRSCLAGPVFTAADIVWDHD